MKKVLSIISTLIFSVAMAFAQHDGTALARIIYQFTHIDDTNQRDKPYEEDLILFMGENTSLFKSFTELQKQEARQRIVQEARQTGTINLDLRNAGFKNSSNTQYILFPQPKRLARVEKLFRTNYLIEERYPALDWEILDEEKQIGGYLAQKATTQFGGRAYTVWFTPEIPFPFGPWKLHGLPGLILEAQDSKNEVVFAYGDFETLENSDVQIGIPNGTIATTQKEYDKAAEAFEKNPQAAMNNALAASGSKARIISLQENAPSTTSKPKTINNPLELDN